MAVIAMTLFGKKGCGFIAENETAEEEAAQCANNYDKINFSNVPDSLLLLFIVGTSDDWTEIYTE